MPEINQNEILFPLDLQIREGKCFVILAKLPRVSFGEPFFVDSLSQRFHLADISKDAQGEQDVLVRPLHFHEEDPRLFYVSKEEFIGLHSHSKIDYSKMKFIFHMSRCGSTLITQMIATSKRFFIVSEPQIFNAILNPKFMPKESQEKMYLLRAVINAIEDCKPESAEYVFIKFRSWNTLFLNKILDLFPKVQWMFVHRKGIEVLESVLRDPPGWMRSRFTYSHFFMEKLGLSVDKFKALSESEYAIQLLGTFCSLALSQVSPKSIFIDYENIAGGLPSVLEENWGINLSVTEKEIIFARTKFYSKDPNKIQKFVSDSEVKQNAANNEERKLAEIYIESKRNRLKK